MKIIPLSEGSFTIDKTKQFIPFDLEQDQLQQRPVGSLLVEIQPFVIITSRDTLLLDAGLGFLNKDGVLQIHQNLMDNNINPLEVTKVLMTHLHKDHSGGVSKEDKVLSKKFISFPNATYYVNKKELEHALATGKPSYSPEEFKILSEASNVNFIDGNGIVEDYIRYEITAAHSLFHQVFWITDGGKKVFFGGDDAPQLQQMKSRFVAKYDYDGKKCMELRKQWWQQGEEERWTFLFYHDIKSPVFEFV
jgi:glyoxylase-like metal-dependent hydrolase (beta-lactamase superfamily II)